MHRPLLAWTILCLALAAALVAAGVALGRGDLPPHEQGAAAVVSGCGAALAVLALVVAFAGRPASRLLTAADPDRPLHVRHPWATLFLASFVILFVEVMFIRYCASQIRVFSFYKNVPLIGCFLGLGLGCCLGEGRGRHALGFLLWMVPMAVFLSGGSLVIEDLLGRLASASSSELILGDQVTVDTDPALAAVGHVLMGLFCVATLVAITLLFALLGRLLGAAFEPVPRLTAYTINIAGSLAGTTIRLRNCHGSSAGGQGSALMMSNVALVAVVREADDAVSVSRNLIFMCDHHDGAALLMQFGQQFHDLQARLRI